MRHPPAQVAAPSEAKAPVRQTEPKGPPPKTKPPPTRPVSPPKASPGKAKAKGPIDIRSVLKAPVLPAKSPDPGSTAAKGAPPARAPTTRTSGGSSPVPEPADPPKAPRWGGPLPKSVLTPPGKNESNFPRLATSEASRKAAEAAKKKAEELKKPTGSEKKDAPPALLPSRRRMTTWMLTLRMQIGAARR